MAKAQCHCMYIMDLDALWDDSWLFHGVIVCSKCGKTHNTKRLKIAFPLLFEMHQNRVELIKKHKETKIGQ